MHNNGDVQAQAVGERPTFGWVSVCPLDVGDPGAEAGMGLRLRRNEAGRLRTWTDDTVVVSVFYLGRLRVRSQRVVCIRKPEGKLMRKVIQRASTPRSFTAPFLPAGLAAVLIASAPGYAASWQPTAPLGESTGAAAGVASDPLGTTTAVWAQPNRCGTAICANLVARSRPPRGVWGPVQFIKAGTEAGATDVQALPGGNVVAAWTGRAGVLNLSERVSGGWQSPIAIGNCPSANFRLAGNGIGDLTLVWSTSTDLKAGGAVFAVTRKMGGAWSEISTVVSTKSKGVRVYKAALSRNGDTVVSWQYITDPAHLDPSTAYETHVSRLVSGQSVWLSSPALHNGYEDNALVLIDDMGVAGIFGYGAYYTQKNAKSAWAPVNNPGYYTVAAGVDNTGIATVVEASHLLVYHNAWIGKLASRPIGWTGQHSVDTSGRYTFNYSFSESADGHAVLSMLHPIPRTYIASARATRSGVWDTTEFNTSEHTAVDGYSDATFSYNATAVLPNGGSVIVRTLGETAKPQHLVLFAKFYE